MPPGKELRQYGLAPRVGMVVWSIQVPEDNAGGRGDSSCTKLFSRLMNHA